MHELPHHGPLELMGAVWQRVAFCLSPSLEVSVLQCVAVCCSVLQCVAVRSSMRVAVCCSVLQCVAVCCSVAVRGVVPLDLSRSQNVAAVLQCVAVCCSV